mgnify:CR=1 FL=1
MIHTETVTAKALIERAHSLRLLVDANTSISLSESIKFYESHESGVDSLIGWIVYSEKWIAKTNVSKYKAIARRSFMHTVKP